MNEQALKAINSVLEQCIEIPCPSWPQHEKDEIAIAKVTIGEILNQVWDHPWTPASETIEDFALKLMAWKATANTKEQRRIFAMAEEAALELLEYVKEVE